MKKAPLVAVIITTWNQWADTAECLASLYKNSYPNFMTIIIDNHSTDETVDMLRTYYPEILLLRSKKNISYCKSINYGFKKSLEKNAKYSLLLNNDTKVDKNFLSELVKRTESDPRIGIVASKMYFYTPPNHIWYVGGTVDFQQGILEHPHYGKEDVGQGDVATETGYCTGCSTIYRNEMLTKIGLADESYEMYVSDVEHSVRAQKQGYKTYYEPNSIIWHKVSHARKQSDPYKEYMTSREIFRFFYAESKIAAVKYSFRRIFTTLHLWKQNGFLFWMKVMKGLVDGYMVSRN